MATTKRPLDQAVELFVYAPIGLAATARELVPTLIERGRRELDPQVGMARTIGHFAVARGRSEAEKVLGPAIERAWAQAEATLRQLGVLPEETPMSPAAAAQAPAPPPPAEPVMADPAPPTAPGATANGQPQPTAVDLSIPDYDSLSASQVLPRLSSLSVSELAAVRTYEEAHRGRKTILHKIAQLEAPTSG